MGWRSCVNSKTAACLALLSVAESNYLQRKTPPPSCVQPKGLGFEVDGKPFSFAGTNVYDTAFVDTQHVSNVMDAVQKDGYRVLRTWAFNELDTRADYQPKNYFQSWTDGKPTINTGPQGLQLLDEVVTQAENRDIKLILTLTNNWQDYGGMDVYVNQTLGDGSPHDKFYTDPQIAKFYQNYTRTIVDKHKSSPAIFAWELANEARCSSYDSNKATGNCDPDTITKWTDTMSSFIKSIDPDHMVSIGIEGYFNDPSSEDYEYNGSQGQDFDKILSLANIDFGTIHIYIPGDGGFNNTGENEAWSLQYLKDHDAAGVKANKPVVFEEYGVPRNDSTTADATLNRTEVYEKWHDYILNDAKAIAGDMSWLSIQLGTCPGDNEYAICTNDTDFQALVPDWTKALNARD